MRKLSALSKALLDSSAAATDPGSKAEGKYDTRSLEMSYLAAGQARQAEALGEGIEKLRRFEPSPSFRSPMRWVWGLKLNWIRRGNGIGIFCCQPGAGWRWSPRGGRSQC